MTWVGRHSCPISAFSPSNGTLPDTHLPPDICPSDTLSVPLVRSTYRGRISVCLSTVAWDTADTPEYLWHPEKNEGATSAARFLAMVASSGLCEGPGSLPRSSAPGNVNQAQVKDTCRPNLLSRYLKTHFTKTKHKKNLHSAHTRN